MVSILEHAEPPLRLGRWPQEPVPAWSLRARRSGAIGPVRSASPRGAAIRRYRRGEAFPARDVSTVERSRRWARRNPSIAVLGGVLAGVLVLVTVSSLIVAGRMAHPAENERNSAQAE